MSKAAAIPLVGVARPSTRGDSDESAENSKNTTFKQA